MQGTSKESLIEHRRSNYLNQLEGRFHISGVSGSMYKQKLRLNEWKDIVTKSSQQNSNRNFRQDEVFHDVQRLLELHERLLKIQNEKSLRQQRDLQRAQGKRRWYHDSIESMT